MIFGLSRLEEQMSAARYFDGFPWEGTGIHDEMAAGDFLDAL